MNGTADGREAGAGKKTTHGNSAHHRANPYPDGDNPRKAASTGTSRQVAFTTKSDEKSPNPWPVLNAQ